MFCAGCGNPIPDDASFCTVCGRPVDRRFIPYAPVTPASQVSPIYSGNPATPAAQTTLLRQPDYGARKTAFLFIFYIFMIVPIVELIVAQKVWNKTSVQLAYKIYQMLRKGDDNDNISKLHVLAIVFTSVVIAAFVIYMIGMIAFKSTRPVFFAIIMTLNCAATVVFIIFTTSIKPKNMYLRDYNGVIPFSEISLMVIVITVIYLIFTIWGTWLANSIKKKSLPR